mgnify:CR=1 FL=1
MIEIQSETVYETLLLQNCPSQIASISTLSTFEIDFYDNLRYFLNEKKPPYEEACKILDANQNYLDIIKTATISQFSSIITRNVAGIRLKHLDLIATASASALPFAERHPKRTDAEELVLILAKEYLLTVRDYARITPNLAVAQFLICSEMAELLSHLTATQVMNICDRAWSRLQFELTAPAELYIKSIERSNVYSTESKRFVHLAKLERELHSTIQCFEENFHESNFN